MIKTVMDMHTDTRCPACPACGSISGQWLESLDLQQQFKLYSEGDETICRRLLETSGLDLSSYDIYACPQCGLHFSHPLAAPSGEWYAFSYDRLNLHTGNRWEFDYVAARVGESDFVGEIGCGTGVFLEKCVARNADAFGVDFSESSIARCREKGLNANTIKVGEGGSVSPGPRNIIASFHVLEHLPDPGQLFALATLWASPEAALWIAVPSDRRENRLFCLKDHFDEPPHHLTKWTSEALRRLGRRHGWVLQQVVYEAMPIRQRLWTICRATRLYKHLATRLNMDVNVLWKERLLRFALYPLVLTWNWRRLLRLTGDSMLAEFHRHVRREVLDNSAPSRG